VNRETKRLLHRQGQLDEEGNPSTTTRRQPPRPPVQGSPRTVGERTRPVEFLREVRGELRRVAWPTRPETLNSSVVVFIALVVLTAAIFGMDTVFSKFVLFLFKQ
jgi:preprotein translocase subunit SecE